jgi:hypothetical protein
MNNSRIPVALLMAGALLTPGTAVLADTYEVTIVNGTRGQIITPPLVATHNANVALFTVGRPAPEFLHTLAEDGDTTATVNAAMATPEVHAVVTGDGPIGPGENITLTVESTDAFPLLTVAAMLASSNDAFIALHSIALPTSAAAAVHTAPVYDAGTEANTESCATIPGPPCGNAGVRDTEGAEGFVHVHSGIHGLGDLSPAMHDWRNPGAYVTVRRTE